MIINLGIALGASIATLFGTTLFTRVILGRGAFAVATMQVLGMGILAYVLLSTGVVGIISAVAIFLLPVVIRVASILFVVWMGRRALSGKLGEETMWAAELVKEEDERFMEATKALSSYELKELGIIAESKEELRDLTIERYEELAQ